MASERVRVSAPQDIERTLNELRQDALRTSGGTMPPVRATVLNLIVYAGTHAQADQVAAQANTVSEQHPLRTIILGSDPECPTDDWVIQVWAHCRPSPPGSVVCFEAVLLMSNPKGLERLSTIALSLLLHDLPVALWWPGDPAMGSSLFERLMADSDRLIVDSATASDPEAFLRRLSALGHAKQGQFILSDLNWYRLAPWRELTAQFFDAPDCDLCLQHLDRVTIGYLPGKEGAVLAQAHLLAAWMATRLGWAPMAWSEMAHGGEVNLLHGRQPVIIRFLPLSLPEAEAVGGGMAAAELCRLELESGHPEGRATFAIERAPGSPYARVTSRLPNRPLRERTVPLPLPATVELLSADLPRPGHDLIYQEALHMAAYLATQRIAAASTAERA